MSNNNQFPKFPPMNFPPAQPNNQQVNNQQQMQQQYPQYNQPYPAVPPQHSTMPVQQQQYPAMPNQMQQAVQPSQPPTSLLITHNVNSGVVINQARMKQILTNNTGYVAKERVPWLKLNPRPQPYPIRLGGIYSDENVPFKKITVHANVMHTFKDRQTNKPVKKRYPSLCIRSIFTDCYTLHEGAPPNYALARAIVAEHKIADDVMHLMKQFGCPYCNLMDAVNTHWGFGSTQSKEIYKTHGRQDRWLYNATHMGEPSPRKYVWNVAKTTNESMMNKITEEDGTIYYDRLFHPELGCIVFTEVSGGGQDIKQKKTTINYVHPQAVKWPFPDVFNLDHIAAKMFAPYQVLYESIINSNRCQQVIRETGVQIQLPAGLVVRQPETQDQNTNVYSPNNTNNNVAETETNYFVADDDDIPY